MVGRDGSTASYANDAIAIVVPTVVRVRPSPSHSAASALIAEVSRASDNRARAVAEANGRPDCSADLTGRPGAGADTWRTLRNATPARVARPHCLASGALTVPAKGGGDNPSTQLGPPPPT